MQYKYLCDIKPFTLWDTHPKEDTPKVDAPSRCHRLDEWQTHGCECEWGLCCTVGCLLDYSTTRTNVLFDFTESQSNGVLYFVIIFQPGILEQEPVYEHW